MLISLALPTLDAVEKIAVFLVMLSVLVVLHEAGHFLIARYNGVRVNDFAVGFGPTLLKWTSPRSGTNYRLKLLRHARRGWAHERGRTTEDVPRDGRAGCDIR
jgi:hypothetical protein